LTLIPVPIDGTRAVAFDELPEPLVRGVGRRTVDGRRGGTDYPAARRNLAPPRPGCFGIRGQKHAADWQKGESCRGVDWSHRRLHGWSTLDLRLVYDSVRATWLWAGSPRRRMPPARCEKKFRRDVDPGTPRSSSG